MDLAAATRALRTKRTAIFLGGSALDAEQLALAERVTQATGARLLIETFPAILERGEGLQIPERLIYLSEFAIAQLKDVEALILLAPTSRWASLPIPTWRAVCSTLRRV